MDLEATPGIRVDFPDPNNLMHFFVFVKPNDGLYKGAEFQFTIDVGGNYPYDPPRAECNTLVRKFTSQI
jgi:ubiquitin-conjugating enzyme E2 M